MYTVYQLQVGKLKTGVRIGKSSVVSPLLRWTVIEVARYREIHVVDKAVEARLAVPCKLLSGGNTSTSERSCGTSHTTRDHELASHCRAGIVICALLRGMPEVPICWLRG